MIGRLRVLLHIDSAICLVGGVAVVALASPLAADLDIDGTIVVRSVGVCLVGYGIVLALLARATTRTVTMAGRLTAVADACWLLGTVALIAADAFSARGDLIVTVAAIPVAALGLGKVTTLRSSAAEPERTTRSTARTTSLAGSSERGRD